MVGAHIDFVWSIYGQPGPAEWGKKDKHKVADSKLVIYIELHMFAFIFRNASQARRNAVQTHICTVRFLYVLDGVLHSQALEVWRWMTGIPKWRTCRDGRGRGAASHRSVCTYVSNASICGRERPLDELGIKGRARNFSSDIFIFLFNPNLCCLYQMPQIKNVCWRIRIDIY